MSLRDRLIPSPEPMAATDRQDHPTALLSVDFEDWHQLVRRRVGARDWERPGSALTRQTEALLALLSELGARATFFVLGMAARAHPRLIEAIVAAGHEVACHGDAHVPVSRQSLAEFRSDLIAARRTIEGLTGRAPIGYRAPAFSITRDARWAYEVLVEQGFAYDASQHDSPRIRHRVAPASTDPYPLNLPNGSSLWEFPAAVWRLRRARVPVGGASYWGLMPRAVVIHGLTHAGRLPGVYLHPHEFDPVPLRASLGVGARPAQRIHGTVRAAQRNTARRGAAETLRAIARRLRLIPYGEAYARLSDRAAAGP
jgi:polysaccharide deacetylase family protein (PEP-CTERM system associated)